MPQPQLQLAVDVLTFDDALRVAAAAAPHFDIIEVGTPLIIECGLEPVARLKGLYPDTPVLADLKIMDAGAIEAASGFRRGADIVTILGLADDATVRGAVAAARDADGRIMADLINLTRPAERAKQLVDLGVDILCLHTAYDRRDAGVDSLAELHAVRPAVSATLAIAGGMNRATSADAVRGGAQIVVVGGAIANADDPRRAAADIQHAMREAAA